MDQTQTIKDVFHVAGDAPDPDGTGLRGVAPGYDMTRAAIGHPKLLYRAGGQELVLEADVHAMAGQPRYIHIICPRCFARGRTQMLTIREDRKQLAYDHLADVPTFPGWSRDQMLHAFPDGLGGLLSVEPFGCTWEEEPELERGLGFSLCGWRVAIDNNVVRDV
jgi:hypothetical protein